MRTPTSLAATATLAAAVTTLLLLLRRRRASSLEALLRAGKKAVCVGKNYRDHVTELAQLGPEWSTNIEPEPILFLKPTTSYAWPGAPIVLPARRSTSGVASVHGVHHELELGVIVGRACKGLTDEAEAMRCVAGFVLGLDITERDEQTAAKTKGMPWSVCKGHDSFLPLSAPFTLAPGEDWRTLRLWLSVNGERRQACEAGAMIHSVPELLCFISSVMTLEPPSRGHKELPGRAAKAARGFVASPCGQPTAPRAG
jgi:acylpyruvate hydrolase